MNYEIKGVDKALKAVEERIKRTKDKLNTLIERLAVLGAYRARVDFSNAMYAGENDVEISVDKTETGYVVKASGKSVLFIEFGTGVKNPEHPQANELGFHHGTYGKGKGADENGWVYVGEQGNAGKPLRDGVYRTYGNPPARAMYNASKEIEASILKTAREVFG